MSTDPHDRVYADLVGGLLDSRDDPATERFDAELARAVDRGELDPDLARKLRFWQRAALRALTDHTRSVLPTVLGALAAAREATLRDVDEMQATLAEAIPESSEPASGPPPEPETEPTPEPQPPSARRGEPEPAPSGTVVDLRDTPEAASTPQPPRPSSLEERRRLIIAGLMNAPTATRPEWP